MRRNLLGLAAVFAVALLLVSVTFSGTEKDERADYVFVNSTEPKSLDPHKFTGQPEGRIGDAIFEGLTFRDNATLKPVPGSAESWTTSPDGRIWTFKIRAAARWSNGDPVTAQDFVWSWKRLQEPDTAAEYAYLMHMVRHAEAYNTYEAQVTALRGDPESKKEAERKGILGAFDALVAAHPEGFEAKAFQSFADETDLRSQVTRTTDRVLIAALAKEAGGYSPSEAAAIRAALAGEADRRAKALAEAKAHFGVDQGVFAPDDRTFVVELNAFTPYFLELTAFYPTYPVHRKTVEKWPLDWFREGRIVSNGPFLLSAWRVNEKIRLVKNPGYWAADQVSLRTVDVLPLDNRTTALNLYMTGAADWLPTAYPPDLIDVLKDRPDFYGSPGMVVYYYRLNCSKKPFDDPRVRKALACAFDRRMIVEKLTRKGEVPTTTIVAPGIPGYESPPSDLAYDVERARKLLAEAGYPGGRGFPAFTIVYNTDEGHKKIAEFMAAQWSKNLGVQANTQNKEWQAILEDVRRLNYDVERAGWIGDYRDPNTFLDMWQTKGGNNQTGWGDPFYDRLIGLAADPVGASTRPPSEIDELFRRFKERPKAESLLAAVRDAPDDAARLKAAAAYRLHLFREAEAILVQDAVPVIPIYFYFVSGMVSPRVEGFYPEVEEDGKKIPNLQDLHPFRDVRMKPRVEVPSAR